MVHVAAAGAEPEQHFAAMVDALAADPDRRARLIELLREDHPAYDQRGTAAVVRMRGWVLLALARAGVPDDALVFVVEELETGTHAYLVAAAARALRAYPAPTPALAPCVVRALATIRYRDEPVSLEAYGEYAVSSAGTSPVRELLATLAWLGPHAREAEAELRALRGGVSSRLRADVDRALEAIRGPRADARPAAGTCCEPPVHTGSIAAWAPGARRRREAVGAVRFEDHDGAGEIASGQTGPPARGAAASPVLGTLASLGVALFPKCPVCWAGYLSLFGIAGLQRIPYTPWLQPVLAAVMLVNVASVWLRARATRRMSAFYLVTAGALAIFASTTVPGWQGAAAWGIGLTLAGSVWSVLGAQVGSLWARWKGRAPWAPAPAETPSA